MPPTDRCVRPLKVHNGVPFFRRVRRHGSFPNEKERQGRPRFSHRRFNVRKGRQRNRYRICRSTIRNIVQGPTSGQLTERRRRSRRRRAWMRRGWCCSPKPNSASSPTPSGGDKLSFNGAMTLPKLILCFRQLSSWPFQGHCFLVFQRLTSLLVPERIFATKKAVFYRREPFAELPDTDATCFRGDPSAIERLVRDLYAGSESAQIFFEQFLQRGVEPWLMEHDGKIVGSVWLFTGSYLSAWEGYDAWLLQIEVEPTARFVANVLVDPDMRGQGVFSRLMQHCVSEYAEVPFYSCVDETNRPSIKAHEKLGFRRYGAAYLLRFFGSTYCFFWPRISKWRCLPRFFSMRLFSLQRGVPYSLCLRYDEPVCKPN